MSDTETYRTSMHVPSQMPKAVTEAVAETGLDPFSWAMIQALKRCQVPSNKAIFLPNLLAQGPVQPYHADEWDISGLGSSVGGANSICIATSSSGMGEVDPSKNIHLNLTNITVNGLANARPTDWDVHAVKGGTENAATIDIGFCAYDEDVLPDGVDANLVITADFDIKQPCMSGIDESHWVAHGIGTVTITIKAASGHADMTIYTTGSGSDQKLHARVSTLSFSITGLSCSDDAEAGGGPKIDIEINLKNISDKDRKEWHEYINNVLNSNDALCKLQAQINEVIDKKDAKQHLASVAIDQIEKILGS